MKLKGFRDLIVWQKSKALAVKVYRITSSFPKEELFGIVFQMRKAAVSIPSNIAEGQARNGKKEFKHFLGIANGSTAELETQIEISYEMQFLPDATYWELLNDCAEVGKLLNGLITSLKE